MTRYVSHADKIFAAALQEVKDQDLSTADPTRLEAWLAGVALALEAIRS